MKIPSCKISRFTTSTLILLCFFVIQKSHGDPPPGYYDSANGLTGTPLRNALHDIIDGHSSFSYDSAKDNLWEIVEPEGGEIRCIYSGRITTSLMRDTDGMNAEHIWPQSRGSGSVPPRSDMHHLFVVDSTWNSRRGSLRFKDVPNPDPDDISPIGARVDNSVGFEPPDLYKGDVARAIFYFSIRYEIEVINNADIGGSNSTTADDMMGELSTLINWHLNDPPSQYEMSRNERIFSLQGNRNPFIDNPEFLADLFEIAPDAPAIFADTNPEIPRWNTPVTIEARIISGENIDSTTVSAFYRIGDAGPFAELPMNLQTGNLNDGMWQTSTTIPAQPGDTRVEYYLTASDVSANMTREPENDQLFYLSEPPAPPNLSISTVPSTPIYDVPTGFNVQITSELDINSNTPAVYYRLGNSGEFSALPLSLDSGTLTNGTWTSTMNIPVQPADTLVQYFAEAADSDGTLTREPLAGQYSFTIFEPDPPVILAMTNPEFPLIGEPITIIADIVAEEQMNASSVIASYTTTTGDSGNIPMSLTSGSLLDGRWEADTTVTVLQDGAIFSFAVSGQDDGERSSRDPEAGFKNIEITATPTELDISGYKLIESDSSITMTFPANTTIPANGFIIVGRRATEQEFEALWGPLPQGVQYINSFEIVGNNGIVINGSEVFTLEDSESNIIDGPSDTGTLSAQNGRVVRTASDSNSWAVGQAGDASPGMIEIEGTGAGLIITEFSDPDNAFEEAFVEIYYDAPSVEVIPPTQMLTY